MSTWLLILVLAAALACPLHLLWAMQRGKRPACCPPSKTPDVESLRERQRALAAHLAQLTSGDGDQPNARPARS